MAFFESYDLPTCACATRTSMAPGQDPANRTAAWSPSSSSRCSPGAPVIHGDGNQTRDFTYIDDAVEATLMCARPTVRSRGVQRRHRHRDAREDWPRLLGRIVGSNAEPSTRTGATRQNRRRVVNIEKTRRTLRWVRASRSKRDSGTRSPGSARRHSGAREGRPPPENN